VANTPVQHRPNVFFNLIGAVLITLLPELLRGLGHYRPLLNGIILIVIILYSPKGIWDILQSAPRRARPTAAS